MEATTCPPVVVALGSARGSGAAKLAAEVLGAGSCVDLTSRWSLVATRQLPLARAFMPDVVVLFVPKSAPADLLQVLARLERSGRDVVVVTGSDQALTAATALGAHGVDPRTTRRQRADLATASGILGSLRENWPPLLPLP